MNTFGSSYILCDDILNIIGPLVEKKRLENCIPTITNIVLPIIQTWLSCNQNLSCKIVSKVINNTDNQRPTTKSAYDTSVLRKKHLETFKRYYDNFSSDDNTSDDDTIEDEIDIALKEEKINNISEDTLYSEGEFWHQTHRIRENTLVKKLLNKNILKEKGDTPLNEENIRKIINQKVLVKIDELEKTKMYNDIPHYFKFTEQDISKKIMEMYYDKIICIDELFDILLFRNCILYSDTCDEIILARYDNYEVETNGYRNKEDEYKMDVDIDYNNGQYNFEINHIYYNLDEDMYVKKYKNIFTVNSVDGKLCY